MTTAHRPTFNQALGANQSSNKIVPSGMQRARDLPGNMTMKYRDDVQQRPSLDQLLRSSTKHQPQRQVEAKKVKITEDNMYPEDADDAPDNSPAGWCEFQEESLLKAYFFIS
jgi:protein CWC15